MAEISPERRADFFVHPDYYRLTQGYSNQQVDAYETKLQEAVESSHLPILMYNPGYAVRLGNFWKCFPSEQRFPTQPGNGYLSKRINTVNRFNRLLDERGVLEALVHGSYLTACVAQFKRKLAVNQENGHINYYPRQHTIPAQDQSQDQTIRLGYTLYFGTHPLYSPFNLAEYDKNARIYCTR